MGRTLHISQTEIDAQAQKIFKLVKFRENGIAVCYPGCKIDYLLLELITRPEILKKHLGKHYKHYKLIPVFLKTEDSTIIEQIRSYAKELPSVMKLSLAEICTTYIERGHEVFFFLVDAHLLPPQKLNAILDELHAVLAKDLARTLLFFEKNILISPLSDLLTTRHLFLQNILYFPVYSISESYIFLNTLAKSWKMKINKKLAQQIVATCGGCLWLLNTSVRLIRDKTVSNIEQISKHQLMKWKVESILRFMDNQELLALSHLCFGNSKQVAQAYINFFLNTGVVEVSKTGYRLMLPLFEDYLKQKISAQTLTLDEQNKLHFDGNRIDHYFSPSELAVVLHLIKKRGLLISRDEIAQTLWKQNWEDSYSDWAIDKTISRIRHLFKSLGIPPTILQTKKKHGFMIV